MHPSLRIFLALLLSTSGAPGFGQLASHPEAYLVRDLAPGPAGLGPDAGNGLVSLGPIVLGASTQYLSEPDAPFEDTEVAVRLFRSDGTSEGTFLLLPEDRSLVSWFPAKEGEAFLVVCERHYDFRGSCGGAALWHTDGTVAGTRALTDFGGFRYRTTRWPPFYYLEELERLFFMGSDPSLEEPDWELWVSDGTRQGTRLLRDLRPDGASSPDAMREMDGKLFFLARGAEATGWGRSDGTPEGTRFLPNPLEGEAVPLELWPGDDELFLFLYNSDDVTVTLWRGDATTGGTSLLADLGPIRFDLQVLSAGDRPLAFLIGARPHQYAQPTPELWLSDGTADGTGPIPKPSGTPPFESRLFNRIRVLGERVYFDLDDGVEGRRPWVSDGTPEGTRIIPALCDAVSPPAFSVASSLLGDVLLHVDNSQGACEPVVYDPETGAVRELADFCPGACVPESAFSRLEVGHLAYLSVEDEVHGEEFWVTDGRPGRVARVSDFERPDPFEREIAPGLPERGTATAVAGGRLFFGADDGARGWELWAVPLPAEGVEFPPRPPGAPLTSPELPGFAVWVEITAGAGDPMPGRAEEDCIPETLCVSGAVPGRSEVFVRVVGPKPNGLLWPTLVKFSTSTVEVWIEQLATGLVRYYRLEGAAPGTSELPGRFDRNGFPPS